MPRFPRTANVVVHAIAAIFLTVGVARPACGETPDQASPFVIERDNRTIVIEPFGANIVRVTLSSEKGAALAAPGYGIVGTPAMAGWTHEQDSGGYDVIRSTRLLISVAPKQSATTAGDAARRVESIREEPLLLRRLSRGRYNDSIFISNTAGEPLDDVAMVLLPNGSEAATGTPRTEKSRTSGTAFLPPSIHPPTNITMGLANSNKACSTCATTKSNVGMITRQSAERTSAFRSWSEPRLRSDLG